MPKPSPPSRSSPPAVRTESTPKAQPPSSGSPASAAVAAGLPNVDFNNAETRSLVIQARALKARQKYAALFRKLGLSPAQQDAFVQDLTEFDQQSIDLALSMQGSPLDKLGEMQMEAIAASMNGELAGKLRDLLGQAGFRQYRQYTSELQVRPVVDDLSAQLRGSPDELSDDQANQLLAILDSTRLGNLRAPASPSNSMAGQPLPPDSIWQSKMLSSQQNADRPRFITDEAVAKAENVLSASQVAALKQLQAAQLAQVKLTPALLASAPSR